jgi:hypothetical protein
VEAEEADSPTTYFRSAPAPWANGAGEHDIARGRPAADGTLRFRFQRADAVYKHLVGTPGLRATFTVDRVASRMLGVTFRNRSRP